MREDVKKFISSVSRPGRYTGGERGTVLKDKNAVDLRVAFCFPDSYEIGMSNLGMRILCAVLNDMDRVLCERVYAPWPDMEEKMREAGVPLFTLDSGDAVGEFDIVAFTMQYELCYTNVLNMLSLSGIPFRSADRSEDDPVIIAGGPCSYNPEPMAPFVDIFSIGEGEDALPELAALYLRMKDDGTYTKEKFLRAAATELDGFYVPSLYEPSYNEDGTLASFEPLFPDVPRTITKRVIADLDAARVPLEPVMPFVETVHDRVTLEVFRGCIRGCRFCQAGFVCRPVRERSPEVLSEQAKAMCVWSGYDEISLSSLSISDYSKIGTLTDRLLTWTDEEKINLSLPSLRADSFTPELMEKVSSVRTSAVTFAPEAGSQRLRDVINKNVTEEEILSAAGVAYNAGKSKIKLYFMNGL
ncbi:MAG: TIGR03960 family B12-binding radical SAM protein, partial [Clostridia bacterium]|nr:TIGR03960 family B12-binding radical SAM protein [Clostridia bacterium]